MSAPDTPSWPVLTITIQVDKMTVQYDVFRNETSRVTLKVRLSDEIDGFPVEYELSTSCDFASNDYQTAITAVMNHPVSLIRLCESPIESRFYLYALGRIPNLRPQVEIGSYRVDFAIIEKQIAIEIDGHNYHKTREQRTYDAQRERYLQLSGWRVIRFTGLEIYRNPSGCIDEVANLIDAFDTSPKGVYGWSINPISSDERVHHLISEILKIQQHG